MTKACFNCGGNGVNMYGYTICGICKSKLRLPKNETIKKHTIIYKKSKKISYEEKVQTTLVSLEKDYIKKRIKLLYIQEKLKDIKK